MKKNITNTKIQKFMWTILLIMILFQFCFPSVVFAEIEGDNYKNDWVADTYDNWIKVLPAELIPQFDEDIINDIANNYIGNDLRFISEHSGVIIDSPQLEASIIFQERKKKGTLIVRAELDDGELQIYPQSIWDMEYLAEGYESYPFELGKVGKFLNKKRPYVEHISTFINEYIYKAVWKKNNSEIGEDGSTVMRAIYSYKNFKDFLGEENDEKVYPIIKEKLKEFIAAKASEESMNIDDVIDELTEFIFQKYTNEENTHVYKINIAIEGKADPNGKIMNTAYAVTAVTIENSTAGPHYAGVYFLNDVDEFDKSIGGASTADAGGYIMDLLFPFVNFIADTAISFLGRIMNDGKDGLQIKKVKPTETYTIEEVERVDVSSFHTLFGIQHYVVNYSPEKIFSGEVELLNIDFISGRTSNNEEVKDPGWNNIRNVIAQWYKVLRMIAIIGLLSVLIYTGIKIIISSSAKDKAKFKEWIINWFVAVAILFFMHYIMSFIIAVTGQIGQLISTSSQNIVIEECDRTTKYSDVVNEENLFVTNLMGYVRFMVQSDNGLAKIGYEVMFIALVVYTFKFTFIYLKRVLNMAFLTLIAPIVALTYPIDKINDGSAQGFQMWLKEYIFNALLQPMHCILYYILLSSAMGVATRNPLYAIIVLMFMTEAEKLLKQIFGFNKAGAGTVGGMTGAFAAGALASNVKNLAKMAGKISSGGGDGGSGSDKNPLDNPKPTQGNDFSEFDGDNPQSNEQLLGDGQDGDNRPDQNGENQDQEDNLARERSVLEEFEEEGALSDTWTDEDYAAYDELEKELLEKEEQQRQAEAQQQLEEQHEEEQQQLQPQPQPEPQSQQKPEPEPQQEDTRDPIREKGGVGAGLKAVGKKLLRPIVDVDKSAGYNAKRWARRIVGTAVGITAAAVQAGISITDGKYNPMEGFATFGAGFVGGSGLTEGIGRGIGGLVNTYREGAAGDDKDKLRKDKLRELQMKRAQQRFADRDDVIAFNKREYPTDPKAAMERQRNHYLPNGVTDLKEMKSCMKYANTLTGMSKEEADRRAAKVANFKQQLRDQGQTGAVYDKKKQQEYIDAMVKQAAPEDKAKIESRYKNLFNAVQAFDKAQN